MNRKILVLISLNMIVWCTHQSYLSAASTKKQLDVLLDIHLKAVAYDHSAAYKNNTNNYLGHIQACKNELEQKPIVNLHREAIEVFRKSEWLANSCQLLQPSVCAGTQTIENLEIIVGQSGVENVCRLFSFIPPATASGFGKVSAALLLAQPTVDKNILMQRQDVLRYLTNPRVALPFIARH